MSHYLALVELWSSAEPEAQVRGLMERYREADDFWEEGGDREQFWDWLEIGGRWEHLTGPGRATGLVTRHEFLAHDDAPDWPYTLLSTKRLTHLEHYDREQRRFVGTETEHISHWLGMRDDTLFAIVDYHS